MVPTDRGTDAQLGGNEICVSIAPDGGRPIVVVDIDGTIADVAHRLHYVRDRGRKDWKRFFAAMDDDRPIPETIAWVRDLARDHEIVLVTGRPEEFRGITERWLQREQVPYQRLLMRRAGDRRPDFVAKEDLVRTLDLRRIAFAIDDRLPVCERYRALGFACREVPSSTENQDVNALYTERP
jgi:hypothetical protein